MYDTSLSKIIKKARKLDVLQSHLGLSASIYSRALIKSVSKAIVSEVVLRAT